MKLVDNVYECLFILDANRYGRDPAGVSGQVPELIEKNGGEVLASRLWNEQKMAYPIRGQRRGTYWLTYFRMPSGTVEEFNAGVKLNDNILRHLVLQIDNRLVDTLVAHARGEESAEAETAAK